MQGEVWASWEAERDVRASMGELGGRERRTRGLGGKERGAGELGGRERGMGELGSRERCAGKLGGKVRGAKGWRAEREV